MYRLFSLGHNANDRMTGGLIVKTKAETMFSRVAFGDLIISVHSIVQSLCRLAGPCVDGTAWMAFYCLNMYIFFFLCLFRTQFFFERLSIA